MSQCAFFPTFQGQWNPTFVLDKRGRLTLPKPVEEPAVRPPRQKKEKVIPIPKPPPMTASRKEGGLLSFD